MAFHYNKINGSLVRYIFSISSVLAVLLLNKMIGKLPITSYLGRYSIILLCIHHLIYRHIKVMLNSMPYDNLNNAWVLSLFTLIICYSLIPVSIKVIPHFIAQNNLIKV